MGYIDLLSPDPIISDAGKEQSFDVKMFNLVLQNAEYIIGSSPLDIDAYLKKGSTLLDLRKGREALTSFELVLAINPKSTVALLGKGFALMLIHQLNTFHEAFQVFKELNTLFPSEIRASIGLTCIESMLFPKTIVRGSMFDKFLNNGVQLSFLYHHKAMVHWIRDEIEDMLLVCRQASDLFPHYPDILLDYSRANLDRQKFEASLSQANAAIKIWPEYAVAYRQKAVACHGLAIKYPENSRKYITDSLEAIDEAIKFDSKAAFSYNVKANLLGSINRLGEAIYVIQQAIAIDPNERLYYETLGYAYKLMGKRRESKEALKKAEQFDSIFSTTNLSIRRFPGGPL